jgi:hypothetical protein
MAKNKTKKATLAERNREALAKAKANAKKAEEAVKETETKTVETKVEEPVKEEKKQTPVSKKTPYETYLEFKKHPHMCMISQTISKNDKGVEIITTEWKNGDTGETGLKQEFSASFVKKGDGIDLAKLREQAKLGMVEYQKKNAVKVEETKPEEKPAPKAEEKKPKKEKEKVIIPEEVHDEEKKPIAKKQDASMTITQGLAKLANHERIDENHQVDFLNLMYRAYLDNPNATIPEEHKAAMREVFDGGMLQLSLILAAQLEEEGKTLAGIEVQKEMYPAIKKLFLERYGVETKALPSKTNDSQLVIDFTEVPAEVKKAAKADAQALKKPEIPEPDPALSEEDKLDAIRGILSRSNASEGTVVPCRMATNVKDAIDWARQAFSITSEDPQVTLATMYQKFNDAKTLCLTGFMRKTWGSTTVNRNPFITHALVRKDFEGMYDEKQVAELVKVMMAAHVEAENPKDGTDILNSIISGMDDKVIKKILNKEELIPLAIKGLTDDKKNNGVPGAKVYATIANMYGFTGLGNEAKLMKDKLNELKGLYKGSIGRLAFYADESAYSKK